jgi:hypothetical protein
MYRIRLTHVDADSPPQVTMLPQTYSSLNAANTEARDLAEIEYCIPNIEEARCMRSGPGVPEEWTVGDASDGLHVRLVITVIEL